MSSKTTNSIRMKKIIVLSLSVFIITALATAQTVPDATYTDCNSQTQSIYQVLAAGKVLLIANAGTNCSICMSHANGVGDVADNNPNTIAVWGSMTTKNGGQVNCSAINSWVSTYGWANVFAFADVNKDWFNVATPQYTVISPTDSTIVYQGSNWNTAKTTAESIANTIGLQDEEVKAYITTKSDFVNIVFDQPVDMVNVTLFSITGAEIVGQGGIQTYAVQLRLPAGLAHGIYLVLVKLNNAQKVYRVVL